MPILKVDRVVSFSSEDSSYTANNLSLCDPVKKWKCKSPGEKSAIAVLQLEKASVISAIDIGNENSAYVEVLVTRSGMADEYKVLLVMSALMSPIESRQGTNINRVRMFTKDQLSKPECDQKWDRIKIVCTQPFNRHVQYGLSFVTFHSPDDENSAQSSAIAVGKFALRAPSPDIFTAGRLFLRKKEEDQNPPTAAAAIRKADHSVERLQKAMDVTEKLKKKDTINSNETKYNFPKKRDDISLLYDEEEQKLTPIKQDKVIDVSQTDQPKTQKRKNNDSSERHTTNQDTKKVKTIYVSENDETPSTSKKGCHNGKRNHQLNKQNLKTTKPFDKLLEGVVIVISGIQNPDRADLRSTALTMGAKYSADWNDRCTHLICAFPNTPKFNQVKGKGKIVTKKWIQDCYSQRKRLPWRRYCLDKNDKDKDESEEEIQEEKIKVEQTSLDSSGSDTDIGNNLDEGSDTEERIRKILKDKQIDKAEKDNKHDISDIDIVFSADTEPENDDNDGDDVEESDPCFKDLLVEKVFFIDSSLGKDSYRLLKKYITAYNGRIVDDPTENIDFYLTNESKAEEMLDINSSAKCIQPEWIFQCHNKQELLPYDDYIL